MPLQLRLFITLVMALAIAGCGGGGGGGGGSVSYSVSGTVSGLNGQGLVLQENGSDNLTISSNGSFTLPAALPNGSSYSVSVASQPAGQTCSVSGGGNSNGGGTINGSAVTNVTVSCVNNTIRVGGKVQWLAQNQSMVLQNNNGDDITVSADGSFTFATRISNGSTYAVTVKTQPAGQTCRVTGGDDGAGGGKAANGANVTNIMVNCSQPRYAYVVNHADGSISTYVDDPSTGRLKWIGRVNTEVNPLAVTVDPSGRFAYVANNGSNSVSEYTIGTDGRLTPILSNSTVGTGSYPVSVTVHPSGKYAYVANQDGTISQYAVGVDGSLSVLSPAFVSAGQLPTSVAVGPSGSFAYVTNSGDNTVSQYTIGADGTLAPIQSKPTALTGPGPYAITIAPSGKYAYVVNHNSGGTGSVSDYAIGADGTLTRLASVAEAAGTGPVSITVDPTSHFAYVPNEGGNNISQYAIGSDGLLTPLSQATVATGSGPTGVMVDATGKHAYVVNAGDNTVSQYAVGSGGALSPATPATVPSYAKPQAITMTQGVAAPQPVPEYAYVANSGDISVSQFTIGSDGTLAANGSTQTVFPSPVAVAVSPSGQYAYVVNGSGTVSEFTVGSGGTLSPIANNTSVSAGTNPVCIALDPAGRYAYVTNGGDGNVSQYTIGSDGALTPITNKATVPTGPNPVCIAVDPSGRYAYVANSGVTSVTQSSVSVSQFSVSQFMVGADGGLVALNPPTVASGSPSGGPYAVAIDPSGRYVYVTNGNGKVSQFRIGSGGALSPLSPATADADTGPVDIIVDPLVRFAYAVNVSSNDISPYTVSGNGTLVAIIDPVTSLNTIGLPGGTLIPLSLAFDPSGKYLYVLSNNNGGTGTVAQYSIDTTGALTALSSPATVNAGGGAWDITTAGTWQ